MCDLRVDRGSAMDGSRSTSVLNPEAGCQTTGVMGPLVAASTGTLFCQGQSVPGASVAAPWALAATYRLQWHVQTHGLVSTLRRIVLLPVARGLRLLGLHTRTRANRRGAFREEILDLKPGELVEVKPEDEILKTLDGGGRCRGLFFMPGMKQYCGRRLRVYKRVERMLVESTGEVRRLRNTVLLDGAICEGIGLSCDRSCFYFWREAWLRRV